jgi:hypothetical protein
MTEAGAHYAQANVVLEERFLKLESVLLRAEALINFPRRENRKIRHENVILKANERLHKVEELQICRMVPKTYVQIS